MPYSSFTKNGIDGGLSGVKPKEEKRRIWKSKSKVLCAGNWSTDSRRKKDAEGEIVGSSVVKLARRNAFELVGLKRPALAPAWRWKMG